jgi:hypothetical protein
MIENDLQLEISHKQLGHLYAALGSLRNRVNPVNTRKCAVFSEGFVDQIQKMRAEIDTYLGLDKAAPLQEPVLLAIQNDEQLEQTHKALGPLYEKLALLRKELPPDSSHYHVHAQRLISEVLKLQSEIDTYLGLNQTVRQPAALHEDPPEFGLSHPEDKD